MKNSSAWRNNWQRCYDKKEWPIPEIDLTVFPIATPEPVKRMLWDSRRWTLCQILREIYHTTEDPLIKMKCRIAANMAKEMATKISSYEPKWGVGAWPWREKKFINTDDVVKK